MKKYISILLCTFEVLLSAFVIFNITTNADAITVDKLNFDTISKEVYKIEKETAEEVDNNAKLTENKIKEEAKAAEIIVKKEKEEEKQKQAAINNSKPTTKTNEVKYGTYGRLYISGFSVALYDYNVNTNSSSSLQTLVNNQDSAAYYKNKGKLVIADHYYQGFKVITNIGEGTIAYIKFKDGTTIKYRLIQKSKGVNTGPDLIDTNGNSFYNMGCDLIMYTCYDDGIMATLWVRA